MERVHPCLVQNNSYIANIDGVFEYIEDSNNPNVDFYLVGNQLLIENYLN